MTKIILHKHPKADRYRAVIDDDGRGWAYPITKYMENGKEVLEATVDQQGVSLMATYHFALDGKNWTIESAPISYTSAGRTRLWELI